MRNKNIRGNISWQWNVQYDFASSHGAGNIVRVHLLFSSRGLSRRIGTFVTRHMTYRKTITAMNSWLKNESISDLLGRQKSEQGKIKLDLIPGLYLPVTSLKFLETIFQELSGWKYRSRPLRKLDLKWPVLWIRECKTRNLKKIELLIAWMKLTRRVGKRNW